MTMPLFAIERQNPILMLPRFDQIAEPKIGAYRGVVSDD